MFEIQGLKDRTNSRQRGSAGGYKVRVQSHAWRVPRAADLCHFYPVWAASPKRRHLVLRSSLAGIAFFGVAQPALADEAPEQSILVTGHALQEPGSAIAYDEQTIEAERLRTSASGRLEDALSAVAGFQQFRRSDSRSANPTSQGVTLRALGGNASSRSLVLLDGVPMADPSFGHVPLSALAPERLAQARVTRGGGAGAFGAGAVAGTIELDSAGANELGLFEGEAVVDDRGETGLSGTLAPQLGSGFAVASARWDRGQGFWTTPESQRVPASVRAAYESWSASLRGVAPLTPDVELQARGMAYDDHRTLRFSGANSTSSGQDASLRLVGHGAWPFELLGYVQARDYSNVVISATNFKKTLDQRATPSTGWGGKAELRPPVGDDHTLRLGADLRGANGTMFEDAYSTVTGKVTARRSAGGRNVDLGVYAEDDWRIGALTLTGGARADRWSIANGFFREANAAGAITTNNRFVDRAGWAGSFRGGALVALGHGLTLRGSAYSGLRQPTLNELYRPFTVFPVTTRANATLGNERLVGFEGGLDFAPVDGLRFTFTAFDNQVRHAIANVTIGTNLRERRNVDAIRAKGVELGASAHLGTVSFDGSLAWTDAKVEASGASAALNGKRPAQTPKLAASATLAWHPHMGWRMAVTVKHVGMQYEDDLQIDTLAAATTLDAFVELPLRKGVSLVLRGENLTDVGVVTRNVAGSIDLGTPRTLWAGLRVALPR
ncbi:MAG: TonB-dependent receptor [Sphingomonadales bacterium]|nr:TonB-dependent receptor [Sphingomonadales bacterium]